MDDVVVRRAAPGDADGLVMLRAVMLEATGSDVGGPDEPWRPAARDSFAQWLADGDTAAAFVAEHPQAGLVSGALGLVDRALPAPGRPHGRAGRVLNVATVPQFRRQGLARACVSALLDWFDTEGQVSHVDLHALPDGVAMYYGLGFAPPPWPALRRAARH